MSTPAKVLKVRGRPDEAKGIAATDPRKLAGSIAMSIREGETVNVTAIGNAAETIALQGLELAQSYLVRDAIELGWARTTEIVQLGPEEEKRVLVRFLLTAGEVSFAAQPEGETEEDADGAGQD